MFIRCHRTNHLGTVAGLAVALLALPACRQRADTSGVLALPHNRYIIGAPAPWTPAPLNQAALNASITERRMAGWEVISRAMTPVPLVDQGSGQPIADAAGNQLTLPTWQTWY